MNPLCNRHEHYDLSDTAETQEHRDRLTE